jgi:hypothetical protein
MTLAVGWMAGYLKDPSGAGDAVRQSLQVTMDSDEEEVEALLAGSASMQKLRVVQKVLHDAFVTESGAKFFTPFFITSTKSNRRYWFLHLANSPKANDVVKGLHWNLQNHFSHFGEAGLAMLGFDPKQEHEAQQLHFSFDLDAAARTRKTLGEELPRRLRSGYEQGVYFSTLFSDLTNETPATTAMLADVVAELCREGVLEKRGSGGERRKPETPVRSDDVVLPARQGRLFK